MESGNGYLLFTKMHGIGNDYIYFDCTASQPSNLPRLARFLSDRHTGIGGDGIILILPSDKADFRMRIFNTDGSEAMMCGNGSRCVGKYVADYGLTDKDEITLETNAGIRRLMLQRGNDGLVKTVTVDMGEPSFNGEDIGITSADSSIIMRHLPPFPGDPGNLPSATAVSMGNPHCVMFFDSPELLTDELVHTIGPLIEHHSIWVNRANIEFAALNPRNTGEIVMRVWERGSGETMACGTGACATIVAAITVGIVSSRHVKVSLPGGTLEIEWRESDNHVYMTGEAATVFEGRCPVPDLLKQSIKY